MSGAEGQGLAGTDPIDLHLPRMSATSSGTPQDHFMKDSRQMRTTNHDFRKSRLSAGDLELSDQAYTLLALQRWSGCLCEVCWRRKRLSSMESLIVRNATPLESVARTNIHVTRSKNQYAIWICERLSDGFGRAVYTNNIAPEDMRQHLMFIQSRPSILQRLPRKLKISRMEARSLSVTTRINLDSLLQLVKALRKVENLVECHTTLERVVSQRERENS